jgi:hypothetical protein
LPPLERVPEQARGVGQVVALADGEDEEPLASMRRTDFRRREEARRKAVAHADQSSGDFGEAEAEMMGDILEEHEGRFDFADDAGDMRPEVARVVRTPPLARDGERLARIARSDDVTAPRHGRPSKVATSSQTGARSRAASSIRATRTAAA